MEVEHGRFVIGETCIDAIVEKGYLCNVEELILDARSQIISKIDSDPFFKITYDPYKAGRDDTDLIKQMCRVSEKVGVGPMAVVAGAIDCYVLEKLFDMGCRHMVLDNDGDIAMLSDTDVTVGLYSGLDGIPLFITTLSPFGKPLGICTSSGKIGHSVSLGDSDMSTVIACDAVLADACATKLGNLCAGDLSEAVEEVYAIDGVIGCLAICDGKIVKCGDFIIEGIE